MDAFRFENLDIWKEGIEISDTLFDIADSAESKKLYRFAEQLRACTMTLRPPPFASDFRKVRH